MIPDSLQPVDDIGKSWFIEENHRLSTNLLIILRENIL